MSKNICFIYKIYGGKMIERIMKAVKSSSKKRGRNITLGAIVGMLLSCTALMGADDKYLWIRENSGAIEFNISKTNNSNGNDGDWKEEHPYNDENTWNTDTKTYINNMTLSSSENNGKENNGYADFDLSYGLRLSGTLTGFNFINNGSLTAKNTSNSSYGIYNELSSKIGNITNNGLITATTGSGNSYGIYNYGTMGNITNNGLIITGDGYDSGICNTSNYGGSSSEMGNITNNGLIKGGNSGISNGHTNSIGNITNNGSITGGTNGIYNSGTMGDTTNNGLIKGETNGIYNYGTMGDITNTGIIYGSTNAVKNSGTIGSFNNYGLLISGSTNVVDGISIEAYNDAGGQNKINNYGLAFTVDGSGSYKNHGASDANHNFGKTWDATIDGVAYKIRNVEADVNSTGGAITNIKSFKIEGGELYSDTTKINDSNSTSNVILNGITDTLLVSTGENKLDNSVINAYGTAVKFDNAGGNLTLSGTTVNGGIDGTSYVIAGGSGDDTLTLKNGTTINGTIDGGTGNDTLNFGSAVTRAVANDGINIQHSISGFEKMNINTNVTLFEKTIAADGSVADLQVTGVTDVTIGAKGVLTLRIDSANGNKHALSSTGSTGTIKSENGGKLLLALNGAGLRETISFGNLTLDESLVTAYDGEYQEDVTFETTSVFHSVKRTSGTNEVEIEAKKNLPSRASGSDELPYEKLNKIYQSLCSPLVNGLENFNVDDDEKLSIFLGYLNDIYAGNPYSYSSELSRKSAGMFRDIVTENIFKPETNKWMIYGGLTHVDGGTKDTYYGKGYYTYDIGSSDMDADTKITGAYMLGEYGVSDTLTSGVVIGGNKLKSDLSNGSKVDGSALYLGAYAKKYIGNLKVTAGAGFQYGDYDADRIAVNRVASDSAEPVMKYSDNYNDITYDIYLNGRYSHNIGDNLFLEPYGTLSYTYIDQDGANEGSKTLAIETDSKSFDYTVGKVGVDLKKVIPHEKGKSTLSAGVSYTKILDGADEEHITGRFKGGSDFDILVAHKNEHSIGLNAKYALELENGVIFDIKGTYSVERDSHNGSGKNKTKGEWIVGAGLGYKF
mgnify:CR=1 FL=1